MKYDGDIYTTNEHYYQAMKSSSKVDRTMIANHPSKGLKQVARTVELRSDWEDREGRGW